MKQDEKKDERCSEEPHFYCTKCYSMNIQTAKTNTLFCADCGARPQDIDVTSFERWESLYTERYGHKYLQPTPTPYDDLYDAYLEDAETTLTASEALSNGLIVRDCVNLRWNE